MSPSATVRVCTALALLAFAAPSNAQSPAPEPDDGSRWEFTAAPYLWVAGFDGNFTLDGQEIDGDGDESAVPRQFSLSGFLAHFEARKGPWAFALSPVFLNVQMDGDDTPPVDSDIELSGAIVEGFALRELGRGWHVLGGVRYYGLDAKAEITSGGVPQPDLDADKSWIDPIVGVRYEHSFDESWTLDARFDVGGFGLGSDFAWNAAVVGGYRFSGWGEVFFGYRALDFDFADGTGSDRVEYNVRLWGPLVGLAFHF